MLPGAHPPPRLRTRKSESFFVPQNDRFVDAVAGAVIPTFCCDGPETLLSRKTHAALCHRRRHAPFGDLRADGHAHRAARLEHAAERSAGIQRPAKRVGFLSDPQHGGKWGCNFCSAKRFSHLQN